MSSTHRMTRAASLAAALAAFAFTAACTGPAGASGTNGTNGSDGSPGQAGKGKTLGFSPVAVPTTTVEKSAPNGTTQAVVNGQPVAIGFTAELRSGASVGGSVFGKIIAKNGSAVKNSDGTDFISNYNDFSSILKVGSRLFEITHFEALPGGMYLSELSQSASGALGVTSTRPIDFASVDGLWDPCAGSVSPWNTHLGSEEYPSDAKLFEIGTTATAMLGGTYNIPFVRYYGLDPATATPAQVNAVYNPYRYGYVTEVAVDDAGATTVTKHYAAGRRALELAYVMPDQKTVYMTDDGFNDALYMFVAKTAADLSEGRLYAARWFQTSADGAPHGSADLYWIPLGPSATSTQVKALIDAGTRFSDIFEIEGQAADGTCPSAASGFRAINIDTGRECLRLRSGQELAASRLESRRYAAYVGATTEFRKSEGISFNPEANRLYISFSEVSRGMTSDPTNRDLGGPNHVRLKQNYCGAVYEMVIAPDDVVGSSYVAGSLHALVEGVPLDPLGGGAVAYPVDSPMFDATATDEAGAVAKTNVCSVSAIANPDNITYIPGYSTLVIGEDTSDGHQNDALWAYDLTTGNLTRILTSPYGSEVTGAYWYPNINGHAYLKVQIQHPYVESDPEKAPDAAARQSYVGYIGPFPAMD